MADGSSPYIRYLRAALLGLVLGGVTWWLAVWTPALSTSGGVFPGISAVHAQTETESPVPTEGAGETGSPWTHNLPPILLVAAAALLGMSAFFSGSEAALFSIKRVRLATLREQGTGAGRLVGRLMEYPSRLLTTILVGNTIVSVLFALLLSARVERELAGTFALPVAASYCLAIALITALLVLVGEIAPKVVAVRSGEIFARAIAVPLAAIDWLMQPLRDSLLAMTTFLFRVTRFRELRAAPFITDEEFRSVFEQGEAQRVMQEDERQMIRGILEFTDATLREILVPRPDVVVLPEEATVAEALTMFRERGYSRMPIFKDDLDHITGLVVMKDLLPKITAGEMDQPVKEFARAIQFVPESMTVQQFVTQARKRRVHLAVVVDEYGGTEGIATLHDALEEVVGDIHEEHEPETVPFKAIDSDTFRVEGGLPLDELSDLVGLPFKDTEHATVAGYLMNQSDKIPEPGDRIEVEGVEFTVEACHGNRVSSVRVHVRERSRMDAEP